LHAEGLGAVWTCAPLFAPDALNDALHLPDRWEPQALILIGFPTRTPVARERIPLAEVSISL
jgi:nitroreductase